MEITLEGLSAGKPTIIKNNEFLETKEYTDPFITEMKKFTDKFVVNVQVPEQMTITNSGKDLTYNRVWVQAILPGESEYKETYNLVYALDTRIPVYKVFRAYMNPVSKNLYTFTDNWLIAKELKSKEKLEYDIKSLFETVNNLETNMRKLKSTFLPTDKKQNFLGELIDRALIFENKTINGKIKLSTNDIIKAYESIYSDSSSPYYTNSECTMFNYYDAICAQITKDFVNRFEKTMLINNLLKIC